jgi:hypothetical protein
MRLGLHLLPVDSQRVMSFSKNGQRSVVAATGAVFILIIPAMPRCNATIKDELRIRNALETLACAAQKRQEIEAGATKNYEFTSYFAKKRWRPRAVLEKHFATN